MDMMQFHTLLKHVGQNVFAFLSNSLNSCIDVDNLFIKLLHENLSFDFVLPHMVHQKDKDDCIMSCDLDRLLLPASSSR